MIPNIDNRNVIILGKPQAGKSSLAKKVKTNKHFLINTDHFGNNYGYEDALYKLIEFINSNVSKYNNFIIEGTLGYRLLRKLFLLRIKIDLIINIESSKTITTRQQSLHNGNINIYNLFIEGGHKDIEIINITNEV